MVLHVASGARALDKRSFTNVTNECLGWPSDWLTGHATDDLISHVLTVSVAGAFLDVLIESPLLGGLGWLVLFELL